VYGPCLAETAAEPEVEVFEDRPGRAGRVWEIRLAPRPGAPVDGLVPGKMWNAEFAGRLLLSLPDKLDGPLALAGETPYRPAPEDGDPLP